MRLADCFIEVLAYTTLYLRRPTADYDGFRARILTLLDEAKSRSQGAGFTPDEYQNALFAVVAWVDEAVMTTQNWSGKDRWKRELLQQAYFATGRAGIEFFNRLDQLVAHQQSVREVYYFCLMLGFKGKFVTKAQERALDDIKAHHVAMLVRDAPKIAMDDSALLFPAAYATADGPRAASARRSLSKTTMTVILAPLAILIVMYFTYELVLGNMARSVSAFIK